jgi:hypothetical protein
METNQPPEAKLIDVNLEEQIFIEPEISQAICRRCGKPFYRVNNSLPTCSNYYRCKDCIGIIAVLEDSCAIC